MTLIDIHQTVPDGEVGNPEAPAKGYQTWTPAGPGARRRADDPAREVREAGFRVDLLPAGVTTIEVAPTDATWVWAVREYVEGIPPTRRVIAVPDVARIDFRDCPQVDPRTLDPVTSKPDPIWVQQLATLTDEIASAQGHEEAAELAASQAAGSASSADVAAQSAANSAGAASGSAGTATTKADEASTSATTATTKATEATNAATSAANSASTASTKASEASTSATNAAASASDADASATAAASSAATASAAQAATEAVDITVGTVLDNQPRLSNEITNGDFSAGVTGWGNGPACTVDAEGSVLSVTGTTSAALGFWNKIAAPVIGHRYYFQVRVNGNSSVQKVTIRVGGVTTVFPGPEVRGGWNTLSGVATCISAVPYFYISVFYASSTEAAGKVVQFQYVTVVDLTAAFGDGVGPTATQMETILSRFPNSYLAGSQFLKAQAAGYVPPHRATHMMGGEDAITIDDIGAAPASVSADLAKLETVTPELVNRIPNGNFADGVTGWGGWLGTVSAASNMLTFTGSGGGPNTSAFYQHASEHYAVWGNVYYLRAQVRVNNAGAFQIGIRTAGKVEYTPSPEVGRWYTLSAILSCSETGTAQFSYIYVDYPQAADTTGTTFDVKNVLSINLTAAFGAGKEPTVERMNEILSAWPNSWFSGTEHLRAQPRDVAFPNSERLAKLLPGRNLLNPATITKHVYVSGSTGALVPVKQSQQWWTSDFIPIKENTNYAAPVFWYRAWYDKSKTFISGGSNVVATEKSPNGAAYIRLSGAGYGDTAEFLLVEGSSAPASTFTPFSLRVDPAQITELDPDLVTLDAGGTTLSEALMMVERPAVTLNLPPTIPAVVGHEVNVYFDAIVKDYRSYDIDVTCTVGTQQVERWTHVPTKAGTYTLTVTLYRDGAQVATASSSLVVKAASVGTGVTRNVIVIGDSTTAGGTAVAEMVNLFGTDPMDVVGLGTVGTAPNQHEGRGGWTANNYCNLVAPGGVTNPFWDGTGFNFAWYKTQHGYTAVDYVVLNLGINDMFGFTTDAALDTAITTILSYYDTMIADILSTGSKVGIALTIPPAATQDAFGANYTSGQTQWRYKRNNMLWVAALVAKYKNRTAEGIHLVPINVGIDTVHGFPSKSVAVSSRDSTTVTRQNNGVHPTSSGYYQVADQYYCWIKSFES